MDQKSWMDAFRRSSAEKHWNPNQDRDDYEGGARWNPGDYRASWQGSWAGQHVSFQDTTSVPPMRFTDNPPNSICARDTLQIVSIKIKSISGGLKWPLHVFGMVAARDVLDGNKQNIIYARARSNYQTITEECPYLALSGPTRAVVTCSDPGTIDVALKVMGATESDDRDLSFLVLMLRNRRYCSYNKDYTSKLRTLQLTFRHIEHAMEATIALRLTGGPSSLPSGFQGLFTASTASVDDAEVLLLAYGQDKVPLDDDGTINLSRCVVSVESPRGELKVSIIARYEEDDEIARRYDILFKPRYDGRSDGVLKVGACKMQITVAWSLFSHI